jgi:hypothetical protein
MRLATRRFSFWRARFIADFMFANSIPPTQNPKWDITPTLQFCPIHQVDMVSLIVVPPAIIPTIAITPAGQ